MLKLPYGNANFEVVRSNGLFYVDKTPFLPRLEDWMTLGTNLIFLRPRRFGKSSLISLLEYYYDKARAKKYENLFRGLWVYDHPTPEKSSYLVLRFDFSSVNDQSRGEEGLRRSFLDCLEHGLALMAGRYPQYPQIDALVERLDTYGDPAGVMQAIVEVAARIDEKLYVLIDEYDTFATALLTGDLKNLYEKVTDKIGFVRAFYRVLKEGSQDGTIGRVFITGVTPILLDDMVTGFNVATPISNMAQFNTLAGFSKTDVARALDAFLEGEEEFLQLPGVKNRESLLSLLEEYYDGYRFSPQAKERVFNSNAVIYFLREMAGLRDLPTQMLDPNGRTDYKKLHSLWAAMGPAAEERRHVIETVLDTGHVEGDLLPTFGSKNEPTTSQFVSLMYYTGMLTLSQTAASTKRYRFDIPNRVMREQNWEHYTNLLYEMDSVQLADDPVSLACFSMVKDGNIAPFCQIIRDRLLSVLSLRDLRKQSEQAMRMMLIGAMITSRVFYVLTEKESKGGYNDLFVAPLSSVPGAHYAWMLELKYVRKNAEESTIEAEFADAEKQLRKYASDRNFVPVVTRGYALKMAAIVIIGHDDARWREVALPADF